MLEFFFGDMTAVQLCVLAAGAILIGVNKTGIPGLGLVPVIMLALTFESKYSTGLQLTMLCTADLAAVAYYRRSGDWKLIAKLFPAAITGLLVGWWVLDRLNTRTMTVAIALIVLALTVVSIVREVWWSDSAKVPSHWTFTCGTGLFAGFSTQIANAAGPIMALYLIAMKLPTKKFLGTAAWYFMILNYIKLPMFICQGRITMQSFKADLGMLPFLFLGAVLGILFANRVPKKLFDRIILVITAAAAVYMLVNAVL